VGLVNAGVLSLANSIPIIMGANIGTTITSQFLRLTEIGDTSYFSLFTPEVLAPIFVVIGLILVQFENNNKKVIIGQMLIGIGLIFIGMITMVNVANEFTNLAMVSNILSKLSNPILGVLAGTLITFIIQSSSATVGMLQALSTTGIITFATTIPVILGQNIGTCGTSMISSIGTSKNAKRVAAIHLYFNIIGTVIFLIFIYTYEALIGFSFWNDPINMGQIANFHTLFNVISTIMLFPFIDYLEKLAMITIKDKPRKYSRNVQMNNQ